MFYVINANVLTTYVLDTAGNAQQLSAIAILPDGSSASQIVPSPNAHFLYVPWMLNGTEHLSAFATSADGQPLLPSIQQLDINVAFLLVHPSGQFAYAFEYTVDRINLRLFRIDPTVGTLAEDPTPQDSFPHDLINMHAVYGFSADGSTLYTRTATLIETNASLAYFAYPLDQQSGTLSAPTMFFGASATAPFGPEAVVGPSLAASVSVSAGDSWIDLFSLPPSAPLIHCTAAMLSACAQASDLHFDRSGQYLFITDSTTAQVQVAFADLKCSRLTGTASMPYSGQSFLTLQFSPDGSLVYAADNGVIHVFLFSAGSGQITATSTAIPGGSAAAPALRQ